MINTEFRDIEIAEVEQVLHGFGIEIREDKTFRPVNEVMIDIGRYLKESLNRSGEKQYLIDKSIILQSLLGVRYKDVLRYEPITRGAIKGGVSIGVYCDSVYIAERFMQSEFNPPDSIKKSSNELTYTYFNGDVVRWLRPNHTSRGYKNFKAYVEKSIDNEIVDTIIAPSVIFREIEYFE